MSEEKADSYRDIDFLLNCPMPDPVEGIYFTAIRDEHGYFDNDPIWQPKRISFLCAQNACFFSAFMIVDRAPFHRYDKTQTEYIQLPFVFGLAESAAFLVAREETERAREAWLKKHIFKRVAGKTGLEAIEAAKIEYSVLTGKTRGEGLSVEALAKAYRASKKRMKPEEHFRALLLAGWDCVFSHAESRLEILSFFPKELFPNLKDEKTITQAISALKLPLEPGPIKINIDPKQFVSLCLTRQKRFQASFRPI